MVRQLIAVTFINIDMLRVYFNTPNHSHSEQVATFVDEETYMVCLPALKRLAKKQRMIVTESDL